MKTSEDIVRDRKEQYGHPYDNFTNIAHLWRTYLQGRFPGVQGQLFISRQDVAHMMILLKVARTINTPFNEDTIKDIAGYAKCIQMLEEKENE